jgi:hypothetical protein
MNWMCISSRPLLELCSFSVRRTPEGREMEKMTERLMLKCLSTTVEIGKMFGLPLLGRGNEGEAGK